MSQADLYLVRHGETDWNAEGRIQGCTDRPLNETGKRQAQELGAMFSTFKLAAIYSSHLIRAKETARIVAAHHACPLFEDPVLREAALGFIEGMLKHEYLQKYEKEHAHVRSLSKEARLKHKWGPDVESNAEIAERVTPCLHQIASKYPEETVVVVTHGGVIRSILMVLSHHTEAVIDNAGYLHLRGDSHSLKIVRHEGIRI